VEQREWRGWAAMDAGYATRYEDTLWESIRKSEGHSLLALLAWISKNIVTCLALQIGSNAERCSLNKISHPTAPHCLQGLISSLAGCGHRHFLTICLCSWRCQEDVLPFLSSHEINQESEPRHIYLPFFQRLKLCSDASKSIEHY